MENIHDTIRLVDKLGFTVHPEKSVFIPTQKITFLGFILDSINMTVQLTPDRAENLLQMCITMSKRYSVTIREFSQLIGKMVASEPGVQFAALYYKDLEHLRDKNLKKCFGNFNSKMTIHEDVKEILDWWIKNIELSYKPIFLPEPLVIIHSDASKKGWGGVNNINGSTIEGVWSEVDKEEHINYLELKGALMVMKKLLCNERKVHAKIYMDNSVAVAYINNYGGKVEKLHNLAKQLWLWAIDKHIWISAAHVPGGDNFEADRLSRNLNDDMEWMLKTEIFHKLEETLGFIEIDMFASKLNNQKSKYVSFQPDKCAIAIDAFTMSWNIYANMYMFPPFSVIRTIQKVVKEQVHRVVLIAPIWSTQVWFSTLLHHISGQSYILPMNCLHLPAQTDRKHPIRNLRLAAFILSGRVSEIEEFQKLQPTSFCSCGENQLASSMGRISKDGCVFLVRNKLIRLIHLPI